MCPSWHRCRTSFCFSFHGSVQSLAAPAGKTARPSLTSPETCSSANKVSINDDYLRPISDLSRWFAPKASLHSAKWTDLCQRDRQTDIIYINIYINMLANSILILNKCNIYWIANDSKKKYSKSYCLFTYFVALSVGLQSGSVARS